MPRECKFVQWIGACHIPSTGLGTCVAPMSSAQDPIVEIDSRAMNHLEAWQNGAGHLDGVVPGRGVLPIPSLLMHVWYPGGVGAVPATFAPDPAPRFAAWAPAGTEMILSAIGDDQARFVRWDGDCSEVSGHSCPLTVPASGPATKGAAFLECWFCGDRVADGPDPGGVTIISRQVAEAGSAA